MLSECTVQFSGEMEDNLCDLRSPTDIIPSDLCLSVNETISLVTHGAGGWSFLLSNEL